MKTRLVRHAMLASTVLAASINANAHDSSASTARADSAVVMRYSAQAANPIPYGALSALSLAIYPRRFGDDVVARTSGAVRWPAAMTPVVVANAYPTFIWTRSVVWMLMLYAAWRYTRHNISARTRGSAATPAGAGQGEAHANH